MEYEVPPEYSAFRSSKRVERSGSNWDGSRTARMLVRAMLASRECVGQFGARSLYLFLHVSQQIPNEPMERRNSAEEMQKRSWGLFSVLCSMGPRCHVSGVSSCRKGKSVWWR